MENGTDASRIMQLAKNQQIKYENDLKNRMNLKKDQPKTQKQQQLEALKLAAKNLQKQHDEFIKKDKQLTNQQIQQNLKIAEQQNRIFGQKLNKSINVQQLKKSQDQKIIQKNQKEKVGKNMDFSEMTSKKDIQQNKEILSQFFNGLK